MERQRLQSGVGRVFSAPTSNRVLITLAQTRQLTIAANKIGVGIGKSAETQTLKLMLDKNLTEENFGEGVASKDSSN
jgi:hypothetical protein